MTKKEATPHLLYNAELLEPKRLEPKWLWDIYIYVYIYVHE